MLLRNLSLYAGLSAVYVWAFVAAAPAGPVAALLAGFGALLALLGLVSVVISSRSRQ